MKKFSRILVATIAVSMLTVLPVSAWGPERTTYTMDSPAMVPTFNSITDNPTIGDERNFVRIAEKGANGTFEDEIKLEPGKEYEVYIGYHNDAATETNYDGSGIAQQVKLSSTFPKKVVVGERAKVSAVISAANTVPEKVWDEAYITADTNVELAYIAGSAKIYNGWDINGSVLSMDLFTEDGTYLGVDELNGMVFGCAEYSGHVIYTFRAKEIETVGETCATNPNLEGCKEMPNTGPVEVVLAIAIILGIAGGVYYLYRTRKTLQQVTDVVKNNSDSDKDGNAE